MPKLVDKFYNIQTLRGMAAIMVALSHLVTIDKKFGHGVVLLTNYFDFGACGVDIFFVISGFIMATIIRDKFQQTGAVTQFLLSRVTRIYPLWWFFCCLLITLLFIAKLISPRFIGVHGNVLASLLLFPQKELPILVVGWTLTYEMYFYIVIALLLFLPKRFFLPMLGLWAVFVVIRSHFPAVSPEMQIMSQPLCCEFIVGCLIAWVSWHNNKIFDMGIFIIGIALLLIGFAFYNLHSPGSIPVNWTRVAIFGIPSALLIYSAVALELNNVIFPKFLSRLGDASYSIYLSHLLVILAMGRVIGFVYPEKIIPHLCTLLLTIAAVVCFGLLSHHWVEKPLIGYARKILTLRGRAVVPPLSSGT